MAINWDTAWKTFWDRYRKHYDDAANSKDKISKKIEEMWTEISPFIGEKEESSLSINDKGELVGSALDWVILGAIASVIKEEIEKNVESKLGKIKGDAKIKSAKKINKDLASLKRDNEFLKKEITVLKSLIRDLKGNKTD